MHSKSTLNLSLISVSYNAIPRCDAKMLRYETSVQPSTVPEINSKLYIPKVTQWNYVFTDILYNKQRVKTEHIFKPVLLNILNHSVLSYQ